MVKNFENLEALLEALEAPTMWMMRPIFSNGEISGVLLHCRYPLHIPNNWMFQLMEKGYRIGTMEEALLSMCPYDQHGYLTNKAFPQPWGRQYFWDMSKIFADRDRKIAVNGLYGFGYGWRVVQEANGMTIRIGAADNTKVVEHFISPEGKLHVPTVEIANAIIAKMKEVTKSGQPLFAGDKEPARKAGYGVGQELEENESYWIVRESTNPALIEFFRRALEIVDNRLSKDSGILHLSLPWVENGILNLQMGAGGGCSICGDLENATLGGVGGALRSDIEMLRFVAEHFGTTDIHVELFEEYRGWTTEALHERILTLAFYKAAEGKEKQ